MAAPIRVAVIGSTGSIGTQTLEVIAAEPERLVVHSLAARASVDQLAEQAEQTRPTAVSIGDATKASALRERLGPEIEVLAGPNALADACSGADVVVNGVVGFAGLPVTLAALDAGQRLALANKESLIAAGPIVQAARAATGAELIPVDSEHGAIHQCLRGRPAESGRVSRLVLTASGGPFRGRRAEDLASVTTEDALAHPTWSMGPKISVDSSTLMNKGLEVIEAHELFGAPAGPHGVGIGFDQIDVVVHPQSVVHSMAEFTDGSTMAQLSLPDMRLPIGYALVHPDRLSTPFGRIDWAELGRLDFESPDWSAFPCLGLAYAAGRQGGTAPAWLSAANEVAVEAFLAGRIRWIDIPDVLSATLERHDGVMPTEIDQVLEADRAARELAAETIVTMAERV